jgi:tRNA pseudouridine32 synthase/23S rRNA pseudouridine746 synthase
MGDFVYTPPNEGLLLVHHDGSVVVAEKPAGLLSVPGRVEDRADCLIARLRGVFPGVLLVHRLDLDTSGVMVFAVTHAAQAHLGRQFEARTVEKTYVARLAGRLEPDAGRVDLPLIVDWPNRPRQHVNHETGRAAQTDWQVIGRAEGETRVRLTPLTGRSHQLRVHMAETGHPILGDTLYAGSEARAHPRLMLHAERLAFRHPDGAKTVSWSVACPF